MGSSAPVLFHLPSSIIIPGPFRRTQINSKQEKSRIHAAGHQNELVTCTTLPQQVAVETNLPARFPIPTKYGLQRISKPKIIPGIQAVEQMALKLVDLHPVMGAVPACTCPLRLPTSKRFRPGCPLAARSPSYATCGHKQNENVDIGHTTVNVSQVWKT